MSRVSSKGYINKLLSIIGENGLSGVSIPVSLASEAISILQSQIPGSAPLSGSRLLAEFRRQDIVTITRSEGTVIFQLTVRGIHRLQLAEIRSITIPQQTPWDRKWRMVQFDIPSRHAESRYLLTTELKRLGFVMLQNSMWLHPYPCFGEVSSIVNYANLQPFMVYAEISTIDIRSQQKLLREFPELTSS